MRMRITVQAWLEIIFQNTKTNIEGALQKMSNYFFLGKSKLGIMIGDHFRPILASWGTNNFRPKLNHLVIYSACYNNKIYSRLRV